MVCSAVVLEVSYGFVFDWVCWCVVIVLCLLVNAKLMLAFNAGDVLQLIC